MELFNKFRETIFLKEDSNITKQIEELKEIRKSLINKELNDIDITKVENVI